MSTPLVLVLVAVLSPVLAFGTAWAVSRAIGASASIRGARRVALAVVVGIQLFVLVLAIHTDGLSIRAFGTGFIGAFLTWQAWSQLKRATLSASPASSEPPVPSA